VVHPAAKSHTGQSVSRPGSAANNKARQKIAKYGQWVLDTYEEDAVFLPVVFESFGNCSNEGVRKLVQLMAERAEAGGQYSYDEFSSYAWFTLSTALQQGNALASRIALRQYRKLKIPIRSRLAEHESFHSHHLPFDDEDWEDAYAVTA